MPHVLSLPDGRSEPAKPTDAAARAVSAAGAFASVDIHRDVETARPFWETLLPSALASPYQQFAFLKAWADHVGPHERVRPLIAVARDASGEPVALLPFGVKTRLGVRFAGFLGGTHVNFNLPLVRLDRAERFDAGETRRLLREVAAKGGVDVFALLNQPQAWNGLANPLAALPGQPAPDPAFSGPLGADPDAHFRKLLSSKARAKQRRKMRRFEEVGETRIYRAETSAEREKILEAYVAQKHEQLAARGIASVFDRPGVRAFLDAACGVGGGERAVDLYAFELDGEIIAATGALPYGERMSCMFNSIASGEMAKYSPGELLLSFLVEDSIKRGFKSFDLGLGVAPYKRFYCPVIETPFDTIVGMTAKGRAAAAAMRAVRSTKARIKANPKAYGLVEKARRLAAGRRGTEAPAAEED